MKLFHLGDVVRKISNDTIFQKGEVHIITEISRCQGEIEYATNQGAWFTEEDFELIRRADAGSWAVLNLEEEEEYEE